MTICLPEAMLRLRRVLTHRPADLIPTDLLRLPGPDSDGTAAPNHLGVRAADTVRLCSRFGGAGKPSRYVAPPVRLTVRTSPPTEPRLLSPFLPADRSGPLAGQIEHLPERRYFFFGLCQIPRQLFLQMVQKVPRVSFGFGHYRSSIFCFTVICPPRPNIQPVDTCVLAPFASTRTILRAERIA